MIETATRGSWQNFPIDNPKRIELSLHFTDDQYLKLLRGLIPQQMEDKWFIFFENDWLYFHRSWTGFGLYKAQLIKNLKGYSINEFWAERNTNNYKNEDDNIDIENFSFLIARGLLGMDVRQQFVNKNIQTETDCVHSWSMFGHLLFTDKGVDFSKEVKSALFGLAVGDALGVPVEFKSRKTISHNPVTDMIGYGTYNLPPGTWSDDSSLAFCLAEALTKGIDLNLIAINFQKWLFHNFWTPYGDVFDVGIATRQAINNLKSGIRPDLAGGISEKDNGNGSLMRILPLVFLIKDLHINDRFELTKAVSSITHGHIRSVIACFYYLEFARKLINGENKFSIYADLQKELPHYLHSLSIDPSETKIFARLLKENIKDLSENNLQSSGYVLHTLEASIWCLLTTGTYEEAALKAVNLGEDTDTTGAVTGGLAGLLYGFDNIPDKWIKKLARSSEIDDLANRLATSMGNSLLSYNNY